MTGTIIVGVIIALMFLVSFTEWFYHLLVGVNETLVKDVFLAYRIGSYIVMSLIFMVGVFWILSLNSECPLMEKEKPGIFRYMNCDGYWEARSGVERKPASGLSQEAIDKATERNDEAEDSFLD